MLTNIGYILLAIVVLLVLITVHEFGHYIAGKLLKFDINEFSIGFGPAIYSKTKKNGEKFSIRAFPLGGYCAFEGEDEEVPSEKKQDPTIESGEKDLEERCAQKVEMVEEKQTENSADNTTEILQNEAEKDENAQNNEINSQNNENNTKKNTKNTYKPNVKKLAFNEQKPWKRLIVLFAGVFFNFLFGVFTAVIFLNVAGYAVPQVVITAPNIETGVAGEYNQFQEGDIIVAVNGKSIEIYRTFTSLLPQDKNTEFIVTVLREVDGKQQEVVLEKVKYDDYGEFRFVASPSAVTGAIFDAEGNPVSYDTFSAYVKDIHHSLDNVYYDKNGEPITEEKLVEMCGITVSKGNTLGIVYTTTAMNYSFGETLYKAWPFCFYICGLMLDALGGIFTGATALADLGGTITAVSQIAEVSKMGIESFLLLLPLLSMNLALFNILPIPALDGARMVFVAIEGIFRKPVNRKVEAYIHTIGLFVLLGLVIFLDIYHFAFA